MSDTTQIIPSRGALLHLKAKLSAEGPCDAPFVDMADADLATVEDVALRFIQQAAGQDCLNSARSLSRLWAGDLPVDLTDHRPEKCGGHGWNASLNWPHMEWQSTFVYSPRSYRHGAYAPTAGRAWVLAVVKYRLALHDNAEKIGEEVA